VGNSHKAKNMSKIPDFASKVKKNEKVQQKILQKTQERPKHKVEDMHPSWKLKKEAEAAQKV
jgi:hypothetical protein